MSPVMAHYKWIDDNKFVKVRFQDSVDRGPHAFIWGGSYKMVTGPHM
jgi:hypothetical protein